MAGQSQIIFRKALLGDDGTGQIVEIRAGCGGSYAGLSGNQRNMRVSHQLKRSDFQMRFGDETAQGRGGLLDGRGAQ